MKNKNKVEDAMHATRAGVEGHRGWRSGVVCCGLQKAPDRRRPRSGSTDRHQHHPPFWRPLRAIAENVGGMAPSSSGLFAPPVTRTSFTTPSPTNTATLGERGTDPVKVTRFMLQNAIA